MNTEQTLRLSERAGAHAALADPTRLQIVDLLYFGDHAASDLSATLGVPSNLLAHHLKVLSAAGMVGRRGSEGDARRSYLSLDLSHPLLAATMAPPKQSASRILFVCTANTARSHLAAALWQQASTIRVASAGTHPGGEINPGAVETAQRHGLTLPAVAPRAIDDDEVGEGRLVISVCDRAHEELHGADWAHWSIPDPVRTGTPAAFDGAFDEIARRVATLAPLLSETS